MLVAASVEDPSVFTSNDLGVLTKVVADAWRSGADRDWSVRAGTLDWSCTATADHAVDTVLAPAFFLASRNRHHYPAFAPFTLGPQPSLEVLVEGLETASRILIAVVTSAESGDRAIIWQQPKAHLAPPQDFVPRGSLELALHTHDICTGLGTPFDPPRDLCERLRQHTRSWPAWTSPGWRSLTLDGDPWADLLLASGRWPTR